MEDVLKTLPPYTHTHTCSWLGGNNTLIKYQDFWVRQPILEATILAQQTFKADPSDVFLCSFPKTGTTWLKSLAFAIVTRSKFDETTSPLLTKQAHVCIPLLVTDVVEIENNRTSCSSFLPLVSTHLPYSSLPESILASNCKIVYIYRNTKDVIVSLYHYLRGMYKLSMEEAPFEEAFEEFCEGICAGGPYWDHILGFWKASLERPEMILFLKYEDLKREPASNVKRLAEFIGYPFSTDEEKAGVVDGIVGLCSFENLSNLEVNKTGKSYGGTLENRLFFRKGKEGDWKNYFSDEMKEKIDKLMDDKLSGTGLLLK